MLRHLGPSAREGCTASSRRGEGLGQAGPSCRRSDGSRSTQHHRDAGVGHVQRGLDARPRRVNDQRLAGHRHPDRFQGVVLGGPWPRTCGSGRRPWRWPGALSWWTQSSAPGCWPSRQDTDDPRPLGRLCGRSSSACAASRRRSRTGSRRSRRSIADQLCPDRAHVLAGHRATDGRQWNACSANFARRRGERCFSHTSSKDTDSRHDSLIPSSGQAAIQSF